MSNSSQITSPRLGIMLAGIGLLLLGSLLLLGQGARAETGSVAPVISAVVASSTDTGATITWTTDQPSGTQVLYGPSAGNYNASSTLDNTLVSSHTTFLGGLLPNTTYHFEVVSSNASSSMGTSSDMMFMTTNTASSTATSTGSTGSTTTTAAPVLSSIVATTTDTTATITWNSDVAANSQVLYGLTNTYGSMSTLNTSNVTGHSVLLIGLTPNTTYHFQVWSTGTSSNTASSSDMTFMTTNTASTTGTGNTGSTTLDNLQAQIDALRVRVAALEAFIAGLGGNTGGGGTGTTTPTGGTGTIDQNGATVNVGGSIDLVGRNFGREENVTITLNGAQIAVAHADGGGNFSTGSIPAPMTAGTYTYLFTGQSSGITGSATITVH